MAEALSLVKDGEGLEEGCGKEGPLRGIFFAEFHPDQGPIIRCQVPKHSEGEELVNKEAFDSLSAYIIPKQQLASHTMTVNTLGLKILGYPIIIEDKKYRRNQFMFNVCFVCYPWSRTVQFETAARKLGDYFVQLEEELEYLSNEENNDKLVDLLGQIFVDLNTKRETILRVDHYSVNLKVIPNQQPPPQIRDHDVPILMVWGLEQENQIDLTSKQILPFINGVRHVAAIAITADVDVNLVKSCVQNLAYYQVIKIIPIFQYSNVYCVTPKVMDLRTDPELKHEFMKVVTQDFQFGVTFCQAYKFVTSLVHGTRLRDLCIQQQVGRDLIIDEMRLIQFLTIKGLIRRIHMFPYIPPDQIEQTNSIPKELLLHFTGTKCLDEICCQTGLSQTEVQKIVEKEKNVRIICK